MLDRTEVMEASNVWIEAFAQSKRASTFFWRLKTAAFISSWEWLSICSLFEFSPSFSTFKMHERMFSDSSLERLEKDFPTICCFSWMSLICYFSFLNSSGSCLSWCNSATIVCNTVSTFVIIFTICSLSVAVLVFVEHSVPPLFFFFLRIGWNLLNGRKRAIHWSRNWCFLLSVVAFLFGVIWCFVSGCIFILLSMGLSFFCITMTLGWVFETVHVGFSTFELIVLLDELVEQSLDHWSWTVSCFAAFSLIRVFAVRSMGSLRPTVASGGQRSLWSDWADAQADLSLRWTHRSLRWFCHAAAKFSYRNHFWKHCVWHCNEFAYA